MGIFDRIKKLFKSDKKEIVETKPVVEEKIEVVEKPRVEIIINKPKKEVITEESYIHNPIEENDKENIYFEDIWEHINPVNNTQAHHILSVIGFNEWVDMDGIRIRIKEMFYIEYKNEKSLYPYIKTLTDVGLLENTSVGGKRKWKKKELVIKLKPRIEEKIRINNKVKN